MLDYFSMLEELFVFFRLQLPFFSFGLLVRAVFKKLHVLPAQVLRSGAVIVVWSWGVEF